jgi:hypothetical protein
MGDHVRYNPSRYINDDVERDPADRRAVFGPATPIQFAGPRSFGADVKLSPVALARWTSPAMTPA